VGLNKEAQGEIDSLKATCQMLEGQNAAGQQRLMELEAVTSEALKLIEFYERCDNLPEKDWLRQVKYQLWAVFPEKE